MKLVEFIVSGETEELVIVNTDYVLAVMQGADASTARILLAGTSPQTEIVVKGGILDVCQKLTRAIR